MLHEKLKLTINYKKKKETTKFCGDLRDFKEIENHIVLKTLHNLIKIYAR